MSTTQQREENYAFIQMEQVLEPNVFFFLCLPHLSLVNLLHATREGFGSQWSPFLLVAHLCWAVCLPGLWSLPLVSFSLPLLGAFFLQSLAGFHQICHSETKENCQPRPQMKNLGKKFHKIRQYSRICFWDSPILDNESFLFARTWKDFLDFLSACLTCCQIL